jgi:hypothetical protein
VFFSNRIYLYLGEPTISRDLISEYMTVHIWPLSKNFIPTLVTFSECIAGLDRLLVASSAVDSSRKSIDASRRAAAKRRSRGAKISLKGKNSIVMSIGEILSYFHPGRRAGIFNS